MHVQGEYVLGHELDLSVVGATVKLWVHGKGDTHLVLQYAYIGKGETMPRWTTLTIMLMFLTVTSGCATSESLIEGTTVMAPSSPLVELAKPLHFTRPDGSDIIIGPGTFEVQQADESQLRLLTPESAWVVVNARPATHTAPLSSPLALTVATTEDTHHLILAFPGGTALEAIGSTSGVQSRGPLTSLTASRITTAVQTSALLAPKAASKLTRVTQVEAGKLSSLLMRIDPSQANPGFVSCPKPIHGGLKTSLTAPTDTGRDSFLDPNNWCSLGTVSLTAPAPPPSSAPCCQENIQWQLNVYFPAYDPQSTYPVGWAMYQAYPPRKTIGPTGTVTFILQNVIVAMGWHTTANAVSQYFSAQSAGLPVKFVFMDLSRGVNYERTCSFKPLSGGAARLAC